MNTFIKKIYFFSKLSTSIILLLFVIFLSYLLLLSYQGNSRKEIEINSFIDPIKLKIEKNATKYETESNKVLLKLDSLDTKTKNIENEISDINQIVDNFIEIKNQIILLQNKVNEINVSNLYQEENDYNQSPVQFKEKNKLKNIIITKFKNNLNYMDELDLLESLSDKSKKPIFEKLILMSAKKFIGVEELKKNYNKLTDVYIKKSIKDNKIMIPDFLINLVTITPSSNVEFSNKNILYLKDAHEYLSNDNISEAIKSLEKIQQYEKHFFNWLEQARIYESFIQQMGKV